MTQATEVKRVEFLATKYGPRLLLDAAMLSEMPAFDATSAPYCLSFYDILLVTAGEGRLALDGAEHPVRPGMVYFTRPDEVRRFRVKELDGACLFFTGDFVRDAFSDARFIEQFAYWRRDRPTGSLALDRRQQAQFLDRFAAMRQEFAALKGDADHLLRARLYEILVMLNRWYAEVHPVVPDSGPNADVERFLALMERDYVRRRRVADYAREIGRTPGHLNVLCRMHAGRTAGALIRERLVIEAKRRLRYSDAAAASIAYALGFADPAYFSRFFRRETGLTPQAFRRGET